MEYFYRLKLPKVIENSFDDEWSWKAVHIGIIESKDRKEARKLICENYDINENDLCMRSKSEDIGNKNIFLLNLFEMTPYWKSHWQDIHKCRICENTYTRLEHKQVNDDDFYNIDFCSEKCSNKYTQIENTNFKENYDYSGGHRAVIYKVTNTVSNMCYIGKSTQAFTLRWYQHFFQGSNGKFSDAISNSSVTDWTFQVIEEFDFQGGSYMTDDNSNTLQDREQYYIDKFDSLENGYNSVMAKARPKKTVKDKTGDLFNQDDIF